MGYFKCNITKSVFIYLKQITNSLYKYIFKLNIFIKIKYILNKNVLIIEIYVLLRNKCISV